ncbi:hypothetical protein M422DRAFT_266622 [Sphaerobolus stellatus SS14]|uniref:Uncharacterized protein n=1 Tax=Sphaerobolus stellatus (strain SS14) TaxID=990650 RepID=A0A0C9V2I6_SPHS4|nr:hypothetical protein M422DRAFT_266622 [Sphaerobolus stellatus SS14]
MKPEPQKAEPSPGFEPKPGPQITTAERIQENPSLELWRESNPGDNVPHPNNITTALHIFFHSLVPSTSAPCCKRSFDRCSPGQFFHKKQPHPVSVADLQQRTLPSPEMIEELIKNASRLWSKGKRAIAYAHHESSLLRLYPFWVLYFWKQVSQIKKEASVHWLGAEKWINRVRSRAKSDEERSVAERVLET